MLTSSLAIIAAIASIQVLLVVKLADFLTATADGHGARTIDTDIRGAGIA